MEVPFLTIRDPDLIITPSSLHTMEDTRDLEAFKGILEDILEDIQAEEDTLEGRIKVQRLQRGEEMKIDQRRCLSLLWSILF